MVTLLRSALATFLLLVSCRTEAPSGESTFAENSGVPTSTAPPRPSARADEVAAAAPTADTHAFQMVRIPGARAKVDERLPLVTVTKTELSIGKDHIADVMPGPLGFDGSIKRAGQRAALEVLPLRAALHPLYRADAGPNAVRLLFDAGTSYRTALETMFSSAQAGFTTFSLVVQAESGQASLPASTPSKAERDAAKTPGSTPPVTFTVETGGVSISVGDTLIGPGCVSGGTGVTVPRRGDSLDQRAVGACAAKLKTMSPTWSKLGVANVSAEAGLDIATVLRIVEAVLPALPVVHFGLLSG
jgi:hypothetical protein